MKRGLNPLVSDLSLSKRPVGANPMGEIANATLSIITRAKMGIGKDAVKKALSFFTGWENNEMIVTGKHPIGNPTLIARCGNLKSATGGTGKLKRNEKSGSGGGCCSGHCGWFGWGWWQPAAAD